MAEESRRLREERFEFVIRKINDFFESEDCDTIFSRFQQAGRHYEYAASALSFFRGVETFNDRKYGKKLLDHLLEALCLLHLFIFAGGYCSDSEELNILQQTPYLKARTALLTCPAQVPVNTWVRQRLLIVSIR